MFKRVRGIALAAAVVLFASGASALTIDFEGEANGQALSGSEFAGVTISSSDAGVTHLGPTIFNSSYPVGPNTGGGDPDLLVNTGNLLILQNTAFPAQTGSIFDTPNDEAAYSPTGEGNLLFTFDTAIEVQSILLIDLNGGALVDIMLTDTGGNTLEYFIPEMWTKDVDDCSFACDGFKLFDLQTLAAQIGETVTNSTTPAPTVTGAYDKFSVMTMSLRFHGGSPSAAVDDLSFIPEPSTGLLVGLGLAALAGKRRRS
jgi:hypothetical protein